MAITVEAIDGTTFRVVVETGTTTTHTVTVSREYHERLTGGRVGAAALVHKSFEFLLEREPNTSILRSFDLPAIQQYFPEYEKTIPGLLG